MARKKDYSLVVDRDAEAIPCDTCQGYADRVPCTKEEIKGQSCQRPYECCIRAFKCRLCGKRMVRDAEAPEMR
jgi:hypothetical protein